MAKLLEDGSIQLSDGRVVFANSIIQGQDLMEILDLVVPGYIPPPLWPFISGGGGGGGGNGVVGGPGPAGANGVQGPQGPSTGAPGIQGPQGNSGAQGNQGSIGPQGVTGSGVQGPQGNSGISGAQGSAGPQGAAGVGTQGPQGADGVSGAQGNQGSIGPQGATGSGSQGPQGAVGSNGVQGNQGAQGFQGALNPDIYAATRVVSLSGDGTDLTIAAAIAALPAEGGKIFIKQGTYPISSTLSLPDKPIVFEGAGEGTIIDLGANVIAAFTVPAATLTARRKFQFSNFEITGTSVAGQVAFRLSDASSRGELQLSNVDTSGIQHIFDVTDLSSSSASRLEIFAQDCNWAPIAGGTSRIVSQPGFARPGVVYLTRVNFMVSLSSSVGGLIQNDGDISFVIQDSNISLTSGATSVIGAQSCDNVYFFVLAVGVHTISSAGDPSASIISNHDSIFALGVEFEFNDQFTIQGGYYEASQVHALAGGNTIEGAYFDISSDFTNPLFLEEQTIVSGCYFDEAGFVAGVTCIDIDVSDCIVSHCSFDTTAAPTAAIRLTGAADDCLIHGNDFSFMAAGPVPVLELAGANGNWIYDNRFGTTKPTFVGADSRENGYLKYGATGAATPGAFSTLFTHTGQRGLIGIGTVKNTGGVNDMEVRETVTDAFGVTTSVTTTVTPGNDYMLDMQTNFGTARPPYVSYAVAVRHPVSSTTYDIQFASQNPE